MKRALIQPEVCANCETCAVDAKCENHAVIREDARQKPWIDFYKCAGCMKCKLSCQYGAVEEISQPCMGGARPGW